MGKVNLNDVKELREQTGAGLADVKKALEEAGGDKEEALRIIRVKGLKSLSKREGRSASAGLIAAQVVDTAGGQRGTLVEVNAETDFVVKTDKFIALADKVLAAAVESGAADLEALKAAKTEDGTVQDSVDALAAIIGEKLQVSNVAHLEGEKVVSYLHRSSQELPPVLGVLVAAKAGGEQAAHDVATHIAAYQPLYLKREDIPAEDLEKERQTLEELTRNEGKPEQAIAKIVEGRLNGFYKDNVLLDQAFAKDQKISVEQYLKDSKAEVTGFVRLAVGGK